MWFSFLHHDQKFAYYTNVDVINNVIIILWLTRNLNFASTFLFWVTVDLLSVFHLSSACLKNMEARMFLKILGGRDRKVLRQDRSWCVNDITKKLVHKYYCCLRTRKFKCDSRLRTWETWSKKKKQSLTIAFMLSSYNV